jgi:hypothetical protein
VGHASLEHTTLPFQKAQAGEVEKGPGEVMGTEGETKLFSCYPPGAMDDLAGTA